MRTVDRPCQVTADNGVVRFECGGAVATFEPSVAQRAGSRLLARAADALRQRRIGSALTQFSERTGKLLVERAADASKQRRRSGAEKPELATAD